MAFGLFISTPELPRRLRNLTITPRTVYGIQFSTLRDAYLRRTWPRLDNSLEERLASGLRTGSTGKNKIDETDRPVPLV